MKVLLLIIGSIILLFAILSWAVVLGAAIGIGVEFLNKIFEFLNCEGKCVAYAAIVSTILGVVLIWFGTRGDSE